MSRVFAIVTSTRADYGLFVPLLRRIDRTEGCEYRLIVTGTHLSVDHGMTRDQILKDGFCITEEVPCLDDKGSDDVAAAASRALSGIAAALERLAPNGVILLGDRYEILAAAIAASLCRLPVAHIHGGEVTEGAYDEGFRHAITKLSHWHFTAAEEYRQRVVQMGESPDRVFSVGSLGIENLMSIPVLSRSDLEAEIGIALRRPTLLVTLHPETLTPGMAEQHSRMLMGALDEFSKASVVITAANADSEGRIINDMFREYVEVRENAVFIDNLGSVRYASMLREANAMVGNSSSGIIEAPSFGIPTVNIGERQRGRLRANSVFDVAWSVRDISSGIRKALDADRSGVDNPYGSGDTSSLIVETLLSVSLNGDILKKSFFDLD